MAKTNVLKDKKIMIYLKTSVKDDDGFYTEGYKPIHPGKLWAYVRQLSSREYFAAAQVQNTEEMLFTINWRSDLNETMFIDYKGVWYDIKRIDTFEDYKNDIHIYASEAAQKPAPSEIFPY